MFDGVRDGEGFTTGDDVASGDSGRTLARRTKCLEIDGELRNLARCRSTMDGAEVRWLRDADRLDVHQVMGFGSLLLYIEHTLGYSPRVALDRLRVARCLDDLPLTAARLEAGDLHYTTVRELTRVATHATERRWLDAIHGKSTRQVQSMVEGHTPGDLPDDPIDPTIILRTLVLELTPEVLTRFREVRHLMDAERGERSSDSEILADLCETRMASPPPAVTDADRPGPSHQVDRGRARYQVAVTICASCKAGTQDGGGLIAPVLRSTVARAECDAQRIGSIEPSTGGPARATQDIPPTTRRFIWRRDHGRCQAPACGAGRHIEIHHIVARGHGGTHDAFNLLLLCDGCHTRIHDGTMTLRGRAPDALEFERPNAVSMIGGEPLADWTARARARASTTSTGVDAER